MLPHHCWLISGSTGRQWPRLNRKGLVILVCDAEMSTMPGSLEPLVRVPWVKEGLPGQGGPAQPVVSLSEIHFPLSCTGQTNIIQNVGVANTVYR